MSSVECSREGNRVSNRQKPLDHCNALDPGVGPATDIQPGDAEPDEVVVCGLQPMAEFSMVVQVGKTEVRAIVDTAAQVTIISDKIYNSLRKQPPKLRLVKLLAAGRDMAMNGFVAGPFRVKIGSNWYSQDLYVAPIEHDMLLGVDILIDRGQSILDMGRGILHFDGMTISLDSVSKTAAAKVARVRVQKRMVIPPQSVAKVNCKLDQDLSSDYMIESIESKKFIAPRVVREGGSDPIMCIVNPSDRYRLVKKDAEIGRAYTIDSVVEPKSEEEEIQCVNQVGMSEESEGKLSADGSYAVPEHLKTMFAE